MSRKIHMNSVSKPCVPSYRSGFPQWIVIPKMYVDSVLNWGLESYMWPWNWDTPVLIHFWLGFSSRNKPVWDTINIHIYGNPHIIGTLLKRSSLEDLMHQQRLKPQAAILDGWIPQSSCFHGGGVHKWEIPPKMDGLHWKIPWKGNI